MAGGDVWLGGVHAHWGTCMPGGWCAWFGGMRAQGVCVAGGMRAMHAPQPDTMRYGQSMSGQYPSYWNAFLFKSVFASPGPGRSRLNSL